MRATIKARTVEAIRTALEAAGAEFSNGHALECG